VEVARAGVVDGPEIKQSQLVLIYVIDACDAVCYALWRSVDGYKASAWYS
jgi:hypothetical protein